MEGFAEPGKSVGFVFDLSLRHDKSGRRIIDIVKDGIIKLIKEKFESDVDSLYLHGTNKSEFCFKHGEQFATINNFKTDGWFFDLNLALKQTFYMLVAEQSVRYLVFITDRIIDRKSLDKVIKLNEIYMADCQFIFIGIGNHYDKNVFDGLEFIHLSDPVEFNTSLFEEKFL